MTDPDDNNEVIEIDFEVGHVSIIRSEVTTTHNPPRTHDWKIFLRSAVLNGDLTCLIQRCIFQLHPEYPNHKRELKTSPYAIQETGYAGFHLPIDIYFKTKNEPRKFRIEYDLDLHRNADGHPARQKESYLRKYRCTFYNPDAEFREKILAAGGKIVDTGPLSSSNTSLDVSGLADEFVPRQSPQQKRPASPVSNPNGTGNKKLKVESATATTTTTNNIKKKSIVPVTNKTTVNAKKPKLVPHKSSSLVDEKVLKPPANVVVDNSSLAKPRPKTKLIKSQSTTNINPSASTTVRKKDPTASPSKVKPVSNAPTATRKTIHPNAMKKSLKPELASTASVPSPLNPNTKLEVSSPQPSSVSISNLKKIPKKPVVAKTEEKRSHSLKPSSSSHRPSTQVNTIPRKSIRSTVDISSKDSQKSQTSLPKTKTSLKREHSPAAVSASVNTSTTDRPKKTKTVKDPSIPSQPEPPKTQLASPLPPPPKSTRTSPQSQPDSAIHSTAPPSIEPSQSSTFSSPSTQMSSNEDNHIETPMDLVEETHDDPSQPSEKSNSPSEPMKLSSTRLSCSEQSDIDESELSRDSEADLPSILSDDDLRYKLIYIYKRFQLNSSEDLITFVRFFKRHQLIDPSALLMTKATNDMITYDLFLLNPSQIVELADDLGYPSASLVSSIE